MITDTLFVLRTHRTWSDVLVISRATINDLRQTPTMPQATRIPKSRDWECEFLPLHMSKHRIWGSPKIEGGSETRFVLGVPLP